MSNGEVITVAVVQPSKSFFYECFCITFHTDTMRDD